jgi:hypothetical protein
MSTTISLSFAQSSQDDSDLTPKTISVEVNTDNLVRITEPAPVKLKAYQVGKRKQRVRFFISNIANVKKYFSDAPGSTKRGKDHLRENIAASHFCNIAVAPSNAGLNTFAETCNTRGIIVQPSLMNCAMTALNTVSAVGNKYPDVFDKWRIDEINIFVKPVEKIHDVDFKLEIAPVAAKPKDPALNVQVVFNVAEDQCYVSDSASLEKSLLVANDGTPPEWD